MGSTLQAGDVIAGRYRLDEPLGEGGYGAVWKATQTNVGRHVAIKFLKTLAFDDSAVLRFERESKALARLQHPNCLTLLDFGHDDGAFLVTEYLPGQRLDDWARQRPPLVQILEVSMQILSVLEHAHGQKIVHRDLKPPNIIVTHDLDGAPHVKVLDFGIASVVGAKRGDITKTGEVFGTPGYMSPEQLLGETNVGPTADLYAFGVVLYEMLEGERLFSGGSAIEIAMKHLANVAPELGPGAPHGLRTTVKRLLEKAPELRYQSASEVARALTAVAPEVVPPRLPNSGEFLSATPPSSGEFLPTPLTPRLTHGGGWSQAGGPPPEVTEVSERPVANRNLAVLAAVLVVSVVGLALVALDQSQEVADNPVPATRPAANGVGLLRGDELRVEPIVTDRVPSAVADAGHAPQVFRGSPGCGSAVDGRGVVKVSRTDGLERETATVYIPEGYDHDRPVPIVILYHDVSQPPVGLMRELRIDELAEAEGFVVLLPHHDTPLFTWDDAVAREAALDDYEVARQVLCLDQKATLIYGQGAGGFAADRAACALPDVAALATSAYRQEPEFPPCLHPDTPYLFLAPTRDGRDPPEGGPGCLLGGEVVSIDRHEEIYREMYGCTGSARTLYRQRRTKCSEWNCATPFISCRIDAGRPLTPGGFQFDECEGVAGKFPYRDQIWHFFESHMPANNDSVSDD